MSQSHWEHAAYRLPLFLVSGLACSSLVAQYVSQRSGLLFTAPQPTKRSHCLQPYGIVWQRTQTFLIESSRSVSSRSQFSGKTTWCFQNVVHQQAWVEYVPTCSLLGGTGSSFYDLRFILTLQRKQSVCCAILVWKRIAFSCSTKKKKNPAAVVQKGITSVLVSFISIARE